MMEKGKLVISKSGRDKGQWFLVIKVEGKYVYMVDGKYRKLEKPKRKNIKHLQETNKIIAIDETISNKRLNKMILEFSNK